MCLGWSLPWDVAAEVRCVAQAGEGKSWHQAGAGGHREPLSRRLLSLCALCPPCGVLLCQSIWGWWEWGAARLGAKPAVSVQGPSVHEGCVLGTASPACRLPGCASPPRVQCRCWEESPRPSDSAQHAEASAGGMLCFPAIASAHAHAPGREDAPAVKFGLRDLWAAKSVGSCSETVGKLWDVPGALGHGPHSVCLSSLFPSTDSLGLSPACSPAPGDWRGSCAGGVCAAPHHDGGTKRSLPRQRGWGSVLTGQSYGSSRLPVAPPPALLLLPLASAPRRTLSFTLLRWLLLQGFRAAEHHLRRTRCLGEK